MTPNALIALFVISNLPSLLLGLIAARSAVSGFLYGFAIKAAVLGFLMILGGGASAGLEERIVSAVIASGAGGLLGVVGYSLRMLWLNKRAVADFLGGTIGVLLVLSFIPAYVFALWSDARRGSFVYFVVELLFPPFGILRGIGLFFGII